MMFFKINIIHVANIEERVNKKLEKKTLSLC